VTRRRTSPQDTQKIAGHALEHLECPDCGVAPGQPCEDPGPGRSVCKPRYVAAAIAMKRALKATRTLEQQTLLASLPKVPRAEVEACRTAAGGYSFTRAWFLERGLPYPPIAGWRQAVEQEDGADDC
jgi:hypothetical protein